MTIMVICANSNLKNVMFLNGGPWFNITGLWDSLTLQQHLFES